MHAASKFDDRAIANNGLIVSADNGLILECVSSQAEEGVITGHDGNTIPLGGNGVWRLTNPFGRPGVLRLLTNTQPLLTAVDQGIYTCTVPDRNGGQVVINVGLYPSGFNCELYTLCVSVVLSSSLLPQPLPSSRTWPTRRRVAH